MYRRHSNLVFIYIFLLLHSYASYGIHVNNEPDHTLASLSQFRSNIKETQVRNLENRMKSEIRKMNTIANYILLFSIHRY